METAKLFINGRSQAVRLPKAYRFEGTEVHIRREGAAVVLEPVKARAWPQGFFAAIRIEDRDFERPGQGRTPPAPNLG